MGKLQLLWVNCCSASIREVATSEFARRCDLSAIDSAELGSLASEGCWDLVCFNFDFPDMGSLRLIPDTKKRWPSAPIVILTMQNSTELALWALRSRVFDMLLKPVTPEEIERCMQRVNGALQARRTQTERSPHTLGVQMPAEARYHACPSSATRLQQAVAHLRKNYGRHIPESEVALLCEMSPSRFCREFKAAFGVTFVEYLSTHRIEEAKRLLGNPTISVTDIAAAVGFSDPSYFTRVFRKQQGISPSEYRAALDAPAEECRHIG